jgi:hypothetical protein
MWESVQLALQVTLAIIGAFLLLRKDWISFRLKESVMRKEWENVLGQMVLFTEEAAGRWAWECPTLNVAHAPEVRFTSQSSARMMAATMIFAFFVTEEATSQLAPPSTNPSPAPPASSAPTPFTEPPGRRAR